MTTRTHYVWTDFRSYVLSILDAQEDTYTRSLEEYLRSLWKLIGQYKDQSVTYPLFVSLIAEAFETEPIPFDDLWLVYDKELHWDYNQGVYIIRVIADDAWKISESNVDPFRIFEHTILCQIADLYRMRGRQLKDPYRYYGINSPTGNRWYNFDVFTYWECATRGMEDHLRFKDSLIAHRFTPCTWATLALLLELGKEYE